MALLTDKYFEHNREFFRFGGEGIGEKMLCVYEDGKVCIHSGDLSYPLDHIKTVKQWEDLQTILTGKKV